MEGIRSQIETKCEKFLEEIKTKKVEEENSIHYSSDSAGLESPLSKSPVLERKN